MRVVDRAVSLLAKADLLAGFPLNPLQQLFDGFAVLLESVAGAPSFLGRRAAVGRVRVRARRDGRKAGTGGKLTPNVSS